MSYTNPTNKKMSYTDPTNKKMSYTDPTNKKMSYTDPTNKKMSFTYTLFIYFVSKIELLKTPFSVHVSACNVAIDPHE
jgi:hypothetical protein